MLAERELEDELERVRVSIVGRVSESVVVDDAAAAGVVVVVAVVVVVVEDEDDKDSDEKADAAAQSELVLNEPRGDASGDCAGLVLRFGRNIDSSDPRGEDTGEHDGEPLLSPLRLSTDDVDPERERVPRGHSRYSAVSTSMPPLLLLLLLLLLLSSSTTLLPVPQPSTLRWLEPIK